MGKMIERLIHIQHGLASTCIQCWIVITCARSKCAIITCARSRCVALRLKAIPLLY